jgi:hypothetical protein
MVIVALRLNTVKGQIVCGTASLAGFAKLQN